MKKILEILYSPIRKEPYLFVIAGLMHLIIAVLCLVKDLGVHPACAMIFPVWDAYLLCLTAMMLRPIHLHHLVTILYTLLTTAEIGCICIYGSLINANIVQLAMATHWQEMVELAQGYINSPLPWIGMIGLIGIVALSIWIVRVHRNLPQPRRYILAGWILFFICVSAALQIPCRVKCMRCYKAPNSDVIGDPHYRPYLYSPLVRLGFGFAFLQAEAREVDQLCQSVLKKTVSRCEPICPTIVMIIGESYNKHHCGLYNPDYRAMTPRLCALRDSGYLVPYTDVVSPSNMTSHVMRHLFSTWTENDTDNWEQHTLLPVVFREAGYRVVMLNNQYSKQNNDQWSIIGGTIFNRPELRTAQFDWINDQRYTYDEEILALLPEIPYRMDEPTLMIYHLRGQHVEYKQRYPQAWEHFRAEDMTTSYGGTKGKRITAEYANATLYNDFVVDSIWRIHRDQDVIALYFSDHGEEVFDYRNFFERSNESHIDRDIAHYQFEVPMMVLMSDTFRTRHPEMAEQIQAVAHRPTTVSNISQMLFHLAGIETTEYDATQDILSAEYDSLSPRIIGTGYDYDEVMGKE